MKIAMIPARMGSQRLKQKNLQQINGIPLITHAVRKCKEAAIFDKIYVNSEHPDFGKIAKEEGVEFHQRPEQLGNHISTSEQYIEEFLQKNECQYLFQVHSIAPLLTIKQIRQFVTYMDEHNPDVLLSVVNEQIECLYDGSPINFSFSQKTNSQDLQPIERVTWSITGWNAKTYLDTARTGKCATFSGIVMTFPVDRSAGHIIKTIDDLELARVLWDNRENKR